jgi:UDP-glucose 4-epimerase
MKNIERAHAVKGQIRSCIADIRDEKSIGELVEGKRYLFNLAAQTSHMGSVKDPFLDLDVNARGQLSVLEACKKHNPKVKVVYTSTRQVYGKADRLPVSERHPIRPPDPNGVSKLAGEFYHLLYGRLHGIDVCILRLTNTFGPRMWIKDATQNFLGIWIRAAVEGKPFEVWGGDQVRDLNYVDDVVEALLLSAAREESKGEVFNLGAQNAFTLKEIADCLIETNGGGSYGMKSFPSDRKRIDIGDYCGDFSRIRTALGWEPKITLREGLSRTLAFYRNDLKDYL